ncbi:Proteasome subunit beta type-6 [Glycine soja]
MSYSFFLDETVFIIIVKKSNLGIALVGVGCEQNKVDVRVDNKLRKTSEIVSTHTSGKLAENFLETGLIVGGWDKYEGGQIYGVPLGGTIVQQPFAIGGSGSSYLYGFFDQAWKEGMTKDEAERSVETL